ASNTRPRSTAATPGTGPGRPTAGSTPACSRSWPATWCSKPPI
ncbi:MAG: hypothetical protein AVDCRST_MAG56-8132, partial [uncultured Cytophagales bacterium]